MKREEPIKVSFLDCQCLETAQPLKLLVHRAQIFLASAFSCVEKEWHVAVALVVHWYANSRGSRDMSRVIRQRQEERSSSTTNWTLRSFIVSTRETTKSSWLFWANRNNRQWQIKVQARPSRGPSVISDVRDCLLDPIQNYNALRVWYETRCKLDDGSWQSSLSRDAALQNAAFRSRHHRYGTIDFNARGKCPLFLQFVRISWEIDFVGFSAARSREQHATERPSRRRARARWNLNAL